MDTNTFQSPHHKYYFKFLGEKNQSPWCNKKFNWDEFLPQGDTPGKWRRFRGRYLQMCGKGIHLASPIGLLDFWTPNGYLAEPLSGQAIFVHSLNGVREGDPKVVAIYEKAKSVHRAVRLIRPLPWGLEHAQAIINATLEKLTTIPDVPEELKHYYLSSYEHVVVRGGYLLTNPVEFKRPGTTRTRTIYPFQFQKGPLEPNLYSNFNIAYAQEALDRAVWAATNDSLEYDQRRQAMNKWLTNLYLKTVNLEPVFEEE